MGSAAQHAGAVEQVADDAEPGLNSPPRAEARLRLTMVPSRKSPTTNPRLPRPAERGGDKSGGALPLAIAQDALALAGIAARSAGGNDRRGGVVGPALLEYTAGESSIAFFCCCER